MIKNKGSEVLLSQYLNGSEDLTLEDVKRAESEELFNRYLKKFSFNKPILNGIVWPLALIAWLVLDANN